MSEMFVPEGWREQKLGDFVKLQGGYAFKSSEFTSKGVPIIRISNISNGKVDFNAAVYYELDEGLNSFLIKTGDVLIAMSGATTGKIGLYNSRLDAYLKHPMFDPHGEPIPTEDGKIPPTNTIVLNELSAGTKGKVMGVTLDEKAFLDYLTKLDISIGTEIEILETIIFDKSLSIKITNTTQHISNNVAKHLLIKTN